MQVTTELAESGYNGAVFHHGSRIVAVWNEGVLKPR